MTARNTAATLAALVILAGLVATVQQALEVAR